MELLSTTSITLPYARQRGNFNRAYFENQPSLRRINAQPLQQNKFLPILKSGLSSSPSLFRGKSIVCRGAEKSTWIDDSKMPELIRPYVKLARIHHDAGIWLHAWPAYWSIMLSTKPGMLPEFKLMVIFYLMGLFIHISNCASNDLIDLEYDRKVERSKTRPVAAGEITPLQGWLFWALNIALLMLIVLQLNKLSIALATVQQVLWLAYPLMKRVTYWPQAFLGLVHNWGATLGWAAIHGNLNDIRIFLPLHIGGIFWTLLYDTIYAHADKNEDLKAGVKSTAVLLGDSVKNWHLGFATICVGCLTFAGYNASIGWPFYLFMIAAFGHLIWQIYTVDYSNGIDCIMKAIVLSTKPGMLPDFGLMGTFHLIALLVHISCCASNDLFDLEYDRKICTVGYSNGFDCIMKFLSSKWFGAIVFAGMLVGRLVY